MQVLACLLGEDYSPIVPVGSRILLDQRTDCMVETAISRRVYWEVLFLYALPKSLMLSGISR